MKGRVAKAVLGVRPEDCAVAARGKGDLRGEIFTNELIGDHTLVTVKTGGGMITVKAPKNYGGKTGENIGVSLAAKGLYAFEAESGARLR
jgi:multiple sugar transport system ATP-binding protein